jgi:hypothetical protein
MQTPPSDICPSPPDALDGWQLVQLRQLATDASATAAAIEQALASIDLDALRHGADVEIDAEACNAAVDAIVALHDIAHAMEPIGGSFGLRSGPLRTNAASIEAEAEATLASGTDDPALVLLAARLLPIDRGSLALAARLFAAPARRSAWGDLSVGTLLTAFRGGDETLVGDLCERADVDADSHWSDLDDEQVKRVVELLRSAARAR